VIEASYEVPLMKITRVWRGNDGLSGDKERKDYADGSWKDE
jgi:hypothetical protein